MKIFLDLETTGIDPLSSEIVTGYFIKTDDDFIPLSSFTLQCNPHSWSVEAEGIHGISRERASTFPRFKDSYKDLIFFLQDATEVWCYSNVKSYGKIVPFDYALLRAQLLYVDVVAYWTLNRMRPFSGHSLAKVCKEFQFDDFKLSGVAKSLNISLNHHDAKSDCEALLNIVQRLMPYTTKEELYNYEHGIGKSKVSSRGTVKTPHKGQGNSPHLFF